MTWERLYTLKREIKETQDREALYHSGAHRCSHHSSLSAAGPFCSSLKKWLCVSQNELAHSLPAVRNARELHGKQEYIWFPVRLEVSSCPLVTVAICSPVPEASLQWRDKKCLSYRHWASCSLENVTQCLGGNLVPPYYVTLNAAF